MRKLSMGCNKASIDGHKYPWKLIYNCFEPTKESLREALCTLGNGYMGARGAAPESFASDIHYPGTYISGLYNKLSTNIAGRIVRNEDMVNCPNWLSLTFKVGGGEWTAPLSGKILSYYQELDMKEGLLRRKLRMQDTSGNVTIIESTVMVHLANPYLTAVRYKITPENYGGYVTVRSGLDGSVLNMGVARYRKLNAKHLEVVSLGFYGINGIYLLAETNQSKRKIAEAAKLTIKKSGKELMPLKSTVIKEDEKIYQDFEIKVEKKQSYVFEKICSVYSPQGNNIEYKDAVDKAIELVKNADSFDVMAKTHIQAWSGLWDKFDIQVEGDYFVQKVLRLHIFHLLQTASIHNVKIDAGLPARGLHGEAYRGHIFWDELFALPLFNLHVPEISKALLMYRYRRLPRARDYARENGYRGSMFPWQSGSTGEEETQLLHLNPISGKWGPDHSRIQRHISFAIAYNVWNYWESTGDLDFLVKYGAELLISIAQFGLSLAKFDSKDGRYHTEGLMGPDEFHEKMPKMRTAGLKDNAYTNILIVWTLNKAREAISIIPKGESARIMKKIGLTPWELKNWDKISKKMNIIIDKNGIIGQFDGYFGLKELDIDYYRSKYDKAHRMDRILKAEGKSPDDYKIIKQADVVMLFYLFSIKELEGMFNSLGYGFSKDLIKKNYDYYIKRTSHGSTLSKVVHCYVSHLIGESKELLRWFIEVLNSDINDTQGGTTKEGIHSGVMGGSIDIFTRVFAGVNIIAGRICIEPFLPGKWQSLNLKLCHLGRNISLAVTKKHVAVRADGAGSGSQKIPIEVFGKPYNLSSGKKYKIPLKSK